MAVQRCHSKNDGGPETGCCLVAVDAASPLGWLMKPERTFPFCATNPGLTLGMAAPYRSLAAA
jgi:hypothetical protein